jgi:hypothetical protein
MLVKHGQETFQIGLKQVVVNFAAFAVLVLSVYVDATPLELVVTNAPNAPPPDTYTDSTKTANAAKLTTQPNGTFQDFVIDYNGDTKVMKVNESI